MLQKFRIAKEKSKLKLNLLKHANSNLEQETTLNCCEQLQSCLKRLIDKFYEFDFS